MSIKSRAPTSASCTRSINEPLWHRPTLADVQQLLPTAQNLVVSVFLLVFLFHRFFNDPISTLFDFNTQLVAFNHDYYQISLFFFLKFRTPSVTSEWIWSYALQILYANRIYFWPRMEKYPWDVAWDTWPTLKFWDTLYIWLIIDGNFLFGTYIQLNKYYRMTISYSRL